MKRRFFLAASILLLSLTFSTLQSTARAADSTNCSQKGTRPQRRAQPLNQHLPSADPYQTGYNYLVTFYPRWFTFEQGSGAACNSLVGPQTVTPIYQAVVAI